MPFTKHIAALKDAQRDIGPMIMNVIAIEETFVLDLNREQLIGGRLANNTLITRGYRPRTIKNRLHHGLQIGHVDLKFTGAHYKGFYLQIGSDSFLIANSDPKAADLETEWGEIYGLDDLSLQDVIDMVKPELQEKIRARVCQ